MQGNKAAAAQPFDQAWRDLHADPSVQFGLTGARPEPKPPAWIEALGRFVEDLLRPVGRFLQWLFSFLPDAAYARIFLLLMLAVGVVFIILIVVQRLRSGEWRMPWRRPVPLAEVGDAAELDWQPDAAPARAWLDEADALAAQGRFAEALHCLLLRSVEDMARRRPNVVKPALTARELARSGLLPERARSLFASLAGGVERSFFGGRAVDEPGWREARASYAEFVSAGSWKA